MEGSIVAGIVSQISCPDVTSHHQALSYSGCNFASEIFDCISVFNSFRTIWGVLDFNPVILFSYMVDMYLKIMIFKIQPADLLIT